MEVAGHFKARHDVIRTVISGIHVVIKQNEQDGKEDGNWHLMSASGAPGSLQVLCHNPTSLSNNHFGKKYRSPFINIGTKPKMVQ